jgi:hypothetical protein
VRAGHAVREVAAAAGVSFASVARWAREAKPDVPADMQARARRLVSRSEGAPDRDYGPDPMQGVDESDSLAYAKAQRASMIRASRIAQDEGNHTAAQRALRDASGMSLLIARLERDARTDAEILRLSVSDLEADTAAARELLAAICERPLLCANCSRALSADWGELDPEDIKKLEPLP